jgi:nitrite reductase/ring-hydroxylating ferredoxin subunit
MANWIDLGPTSAFTQGRHICTEANGEPIVVFRLDDQFHVLRNVCPHAGKPLGEGERRGDVIVCPYHGFAYNVKTGRNTDFPYDEPPCRTYEATTADGRVYVNITDGGAGSD